jgi:hypothetical protein
MGLNEQFERPPIALNCPVNQFSLGHRSPSHHVHHTSG